MDRDESPQGAVAIRPGLTDLEALDAGQFAGAITRYETQVHRIGEGLEETLWRAEVALYLFRLSEATEALDKAEDLDARVAGGGALGQLARRRTLLRGEVSLFLGQYGSARCSFDAALEFARDAGDLLVEMRARLNLARLARAECEWQVALARAAEAGNIAGRLGNRYFLGLSLFNRAAALSELGLTDLASCVYPEAIAHLAESEGLRGCAIAEVGYAGLLLATGKSGEACALLDHAEQTQLRLGLVNDVQITRHVTAWALFASGRFDDARARALALLEFDRAGGDARAEHFGLKLLACIGCVSDHLDEARVAAEELLRLSSLTGTKADRLEARLLLARVDAKAGDRDGLARLHDLVDEADATQVGAYSALARLFLVDGLLAHDVGGAVLAYAAAQEFAAGERIVWVRAEVAALERAMAAQPVRLINGVLMFDLNGTLPLREEAQAVLDRVLGSAALDRESGAYARAGRLAGEEQWNMRHLVRHHTAAPPHIDARGERSVDACGLNGEEGSE